jgi:hypothetical protein
MHARDEREGADMNEAELATKTFNLVDRFADRVPENDLSGLRSMAGGGEWDELLDLLIAALDQTRAPVTSQERDELRDVLAGWGMPTDRLQELAVID